MTGWPSGLRRWIKAPISSGAWVRIPLQSHFFQNFEMGFLYNVDLSKVHFYVKKIRQVYLKLFVLWSELF